MANRIANKLFKIIPLICENQSVFRSNRKEEVGLAPMRIGKTRVAHSYLLLIEENPVIQLQENTFFDFGVKVT